MGDLIERLRDWDCGCSYCASELYGHAADELARLRAEVELLRSAGVCELGAHNPAVAEYARHWEGRAEIAERERDELRRRIAEALITHADLFADGEARIRCIVPKNYVAKRVALVVLDAEEGVTDV